jgi:amidase
MIEVQSTSIRPWASATELLAGIRRREISSAELLEHYLDRIDRLNPAINAVVTLDVDRARTRAADAGRAAHHHRRRRVRRACARP